MKLLLKGQTRSDTYDLIINESHTRVHVRLAALTLSFLGGVVVQTLVHNRGPSFARPAITHDDVVSEMNVREISKKREYESYISSDNTERMWVWPRRVCPVKTSA